ncbi:MAG: tail fiber domain-containing protein [bacterium]
MRRFLVCVTALIMIAAGTIQAQQAQDQLISYQGYLTGPDGNPVPDGTYQITFGIYSDSTGGTPYWNETHSNVYASGGMFKLMLGSVTPLEASVLAPADLFLQIQVGADYPIQPRTRLGSVPKAAVSDRVDGDIQTGPGYTHFKDSDGSTAVTIGTVGRGGPGYMTMYNPDPGFEGQQLVRLQSEPEGAQLEFYPSGDVPPEPCIRMGIDPTPFRASLNFFDPSGSFPHDPYLRMGVEPSPFVGAYLEFHDASSGITDRPLMRMGFDPSPFHEVSLRMMKPQMTAVPDLLQMRVHDSTGEWQSDFTLMSPNVANLPVIKLGVEPSPFKGSIKMFNPQPEPPANPVWEVSTNDFGGASWVMFNPQPEPPGAVFHVETNFSGKGDEVTLELTDSDTDIQTKLTPGRVKVGSDVSDWMAKGELHCGDDSATFYIQGMAGPAPGPAVAMLASSTEAKMGIGTLTPTEALHVEGNICYTGTIGACSDGRYKQDVENLDDALDKVEHLRGVNYRWNTQQYPDKRFDDAEHVGFIAQEVQEVVPEIVQEHADGTLSVDYGRLTPLLVEAIKELRAENKELKQRLELLEKR